MKKRKFFAHPTFTKEFTTENISQVYFPYFVADINASDHLSGTGGIRIKKYTLDDETHDSETVYDVDTYHVERSFISPSMG